MNIRSYDPADLNDILMIDRQSFPRPVTRAEFDAYLKHRNVLCVVADDGGLVVGYMLYQLGMQIRSICSIGVLRDCRRQGVGSALVKYLQDCAIVNGIDHVDAMVLVRYEADSFLKHCGFRLRTVCKEAQFWQWRPFSECGESVAQESERIEE